MRRRRPARWLGVGPVSSRQFRKTIRGRDARPARPGGHPGLSRCERPPRRSKAKTGQNLLRVILGYARPGGAARPHLPPGATIRLALPSARPCRRGSFCAPSSGWPFREIRPFARSMVRRSRANNRLSSQDAPSPRRRPHPLAGGPIPSSPAQSRSRPTYLPSVVLPPRSCHSEQSEESTWTSANMGPIWKHRAVMLTGQIDQQMIHSEELPQPTRLGQTDRRQIVGTNLVSGNLAVFD
jgi:hypothetical protein